MRELLSNMYGARKRFSATFVREGKKRAYRGYGSNMDGTDTTLLFKHVREYESGRIVADHLWFNLTVAFNQLNDGMGLFDGEIVSFDARVDSYVKGYRREGFDYKLSRPTKVVAHSCPDWEDYDGPEHSRTIAENGVQAPGVVGRQ
ncbi:hypothetical protein [Paludibaculum fermentans]|uniref:hypothetical protein n=1 Tax=Paludibaculum fermentans TaxID=1473598 RepID=UPI003EB9DC35